jgi:hypothetical protein
MLATLTPAHAIAESIIQKYMEHPLGDKDVKWCLQNQEAVINIDTKTRCIWIDTVRISYKALAHILKTRADLDLLFPSQLYHCYCVFIRCGELDTKLRDEGHCDRLSE